MLSYCVSFVGVVLILSVMFMSGYHVVCQAGLPALNGIKCPLVMTFFSPFSLRLGYFSPRRGCPTVLKLVRIIILFRGCIENTVHCLFQVSCNTIDKRTVIISSPSTSPLTCPNVLCNQTKHQPRIRQPNRLSIQAVRLQYIKLGVSWSSDKAGCAMLHFVWYPNLCLGLMHCVFIIWTNMKNECNKGENMQWILHGEVYI